MFWVLLLYSIMIYFRNPIAPSASFRDLKLENVLIDKDGYCIIVDLGFGKVIYIVPTC